MEKKQKAVLFGAGGVGLMALDYFGVENVECFVDNNPDKVGNFLCGKKIVSFETMLNNYGNNDKYRIYLTTDTFFAQLADQLNNSGVTNYSFYRDFIPDYNSVKQLMSDSLLRADKIAIVGTTNVTELIINAIKELKKEDNILCIADYNKSKLVGNKFYSYNVLPISNIIDLSGIDKVIVTIPKELIEKEISDITEKGITILFAQEAIKYIPQDCLEQEKLYKEIDPEEILTSKRMDVIPRYLLMKSILNCGEPDDYVKSLYARTILLWNDANEKMGVFSTRAKKNVKEHIECAKSLLSSMHESGFDSNNYIPVTKDFLIDGAHRLAAALVLNEKIWVKKVNNLSQPCDFSWFIKNGFSLQDKMELLYGFTEIYPVCGMYVVFSPAAEKLDYIINMIESKMTIVGCFELDFTNNFYAFINIINEIYSTYEGNSAMLRKIDNLLKQPLTFHIIITSDENCKDNLYGMMTQTKYEIRDELTFDIPAEEYCTIHGTDSRDEFLKLREVLLSYNNYVQLMKRVNTEYSPDFLRRICSLKNHCKERKIPLSDICVVSGAVLEAMGIRHSDDIDIIASERIRKQLNSNGTYTFDSNNEIVSVGRMRTEYGDLLPDDSIIYDHNQYFILYGCKFCNIENVKYQKLFSANHRDKDDSDIRLIEIFEDFSTYFNGTNELKKQMKKRFNGI